MFELATTTDPAVRRREYACVRACVFLDEQCFAGSRTVVDYFRQSNLLKRTAATEAVKCEEVKRTEGED